MESMNDNKFENSLKNHKFKERASKKLLNQLQNEASWNTPWYQRHGPIFSALILLVIILLIVLSTKPESKSVEIPAPSEIELVQPVEQVIADIRYGSNLKQKFLLNFGDAPETFFDARNELAQQFESHNL